MSTDSALDTRAELVEILGNRERRHRLAAEFRKRGLAAQIREMRVARGLTQAELAVASGKVQETISQLENPDYGRYTITTLERLADALDVPLFVRFGTWSELANRIAGLLPVDLAVPDFEHDPGICFGPYDAATGVTLDRRQVEKEGMHQEASQPELRLVVFKPLDEPSGVVSDHGTPTIYGSNVTRFKAEHVVPRDSQTVVMG